MTIVDQITREAEALPARQRQEALKMLRSFRKKNPQSPRSKKPARKTLGQARTAIQAAKGMWRDRSDLPSETVKASLELRRRMMLR